MSNHVVLVGTQTKTAIVAACIGLFLAQTAQADSLSLGSYGLSQTNHNSVISISTRSGSYAFSVSTWHMSRRHGHHENLAPKAKIIDVQEALTNSACAFGHGVCVLRAPPMDAL